MSKLIRLKKNSMVNMFRLRFARNASIIVMYKNGKAERYSLSDTNDSGLLSVTTESTGKERIVKASIYQFIKNIKCFDQVIDVQMYF